jgi:hypothetical protein
MQFDHLLEGLRGVLGGDVLQRQHEMADFLAQWQIAQGVVHFQAIGGGTFAASVVDQLRGGRINVDDRIAIEQ